MNRRSISLVACWGLFLALTSISGSLTVIHSTSPRIDSLWKEYYSALRIRATGNESVSFQLPADLLLEFADSDYLRQSVAYGSVGVNSDTVMSVDVSFSPGAVFIIYGDVWNDFPDGTKRLSDGQMPQGSGECLISDELALYNGIRLGDRVSFITEDGTFTYDMAVSGFYTDKSASSRNSVYTTLSTLLDEGRTQVPGVRISMTYYLKDPEMRLSFEEELRVKGLPDSYLVQPDVQGFVRAAGALIKKRTVAVMVSGAGFFSGGLFVFMLGLRLRRKRAAQDIPAPKTVRRVLLICAAVLFMSAAETAGILLAVYLFEVQPVQLFWVITETKAVGLLFLAICFGKKSVHIKYP